MKYADRNFNSIMKKEFGGKVYKLSLSSGCTCPNRDGKAGTGGCIFCSGSGSGDFAGDPSLSVSLQIEQAKEKVKNKLSGDFAGYMAYFQSFSSTYGDPGLLRQKFLEAASHPEILCLSIATRPDCLPPEIMDVLREVNGIKPVWVELGLQTIHEKTAELINRCYGLCVYDDAVKRLHEAGIRVVTHLIIGLPGETREMIKESAAYAGRRTDALKLTLLHVLKGTRLAGLISSGSLSIEEYTLDSYAELLKELMDIIPDNVSIHRITGDPPRGLLISPEWTSDKKHVMNRLLRELS